MKKKLFLILIIFFLIPCIIFANGAIGFGNKYMYELEVINKNGTSVYDNNLQKDVVLKYGEKISVTSESYEQGQLSSCILGFERYQTDNMSDFKMINSDVLFIPNDKEVVKDSDIYISYFNGKKVNLYASPSCFSDIIGAIDNGTIITNVRHLISEGKETNMGWYYVETSNKKGWIFCNNSDYSFLKKMNSSIFLPFDLELSSSNGNKIILPANKKIDNYYASFYNDIDIINFAIESNGMFYERKISIGFDLYYIGGITKIEKVKTIDKTKLYEKMVFNNDNKLEFYNEITIIPENQIMNVLFAYDFSSISNRNSGSIYVCYGDTCGWISYNAECNSDKNNECKNKETVENYYDSTNAEIDKDNDNSSINDDIKNRNYNSDVENNASINKKNDKKILSICIEYCIVLSFSVLLIAIKINKNKQ